jgi:hypothetical protein
LDGTVCSSVVRVCHLCVCHSCTWPFFFPVSLPLLPWCSRYAALGKTRTRYLLYKDVNRNPLIWSKKPFWMDTSKAINQDVELCQLWRNFLGDGYRKEKKKGRSDYRLRPEKSPNQMAWEFRRALVMFIADDTFWIVKLPCCTVYRVAYFVVGNTGQVGYGVFTSEISFMADPINFSCAYRTKHFLIQRYVEGKHRYARISDQVHFMKHQVYGSSSICWRQI